MRRREFLALLWRGGGSMAGRAQQPAMPVIGFIRERLWPSSCGSLAVATNAPGKSFLPCWLNLRNKIARLPELLRGA